MRRMSGTRSRATAQVGTRSRLIRGSTCDGHLRCTTSDGRGTPARPALQVWNASVHVLRRTRRRSEALQRMLPPLLVQPPVELEGSADQRQMRKCLREIAQMLARGAQLFCEKAQVIGVTQHLLKQESGSF